MTGSRARFAVRRLLRGIRWYLHEISGDAAYERYCARHLREHPDRPAPSRRDYERHRSRHREHNPASRCC
ncbi:MAG TPA: YbdD/YjiX family protein [Yinghuangia sp.]|uniref:YbdD/YjiX family protein n=1 Tax=Yinghuangia sp. YIM S10712 TaxID=3436930 RepID=UPI002BAF04E6|nr:YbdD/YjiX family protein [Yinghuangia sp.]